MQVNKAFDAVAANYDELFTFSLIGGQVRKIIQKYLIKNVIAGSHILEINCGSGEDAYFLAVLGCEVTAADASPEMINICLSKSTVNKEKKNPAFFNLAIQEIASILKDKKFDLVLSNFSGLNCLDPIDLKAFSSSIAACLNPGSKMIFVVFGKKCLWEKLYFLLKSRWSEMNRRSRNSIVKVNISGTELPVFYYSPKELCKIFQSDFKTTRIKPVGFFIPPSYLNSFFNNKKVFFRILTFLEKLIGKYSVLSDFSDHYLIEFRLK